MQQPVESVEMESQESILEFWFGDEPDDAAVAAKRAPLWWSGDPGTDAETRRRFEPHVEAAGAGELDEWRSSIRGRLALVLLTDQFPRSIYRGTPAAFAFDAIARSMCLESLADGSDRKLRPIERVFLYLPFEHSESLTDQDRAVSSSRPRRRRQAEAHATVRGLPRLRAPAPGPSSSASATSHIAMNPRASVHAGRDRVPREPGSRSLPTLCPRHLGT
jgi:uncharacterized protein (DUF924 family)